MARRGRRSEKRTQRPHRPDVLGPRVFARGRWLAADLRPWRGERVTLRNPESPGWPKRGERTDWPEVAERWKWAYVDRLRDGTRRRLLKLGGDARNLETAVREHLDHREATSEPSTFRNARAVLTGHLLGLDDCTTTADVTTEKLQALFNRLAQQGYKPSSLETYRQYMLGFFAWCGGDNPASGVRLRESHHPDAVAWTDDEIAVLRRVADRLDRRKARSASWPRSFRLWLELGLGSGARRNEMLALEWSHFRRRDRSVRISAQLNDRGTGLKGLKGKRNRTTLVLPCFWDHVGRAIPTTGYVLLPRPHAGAAHHAIRDWALVLYEAAGLATARKGWHTLRHTYARLFLEAGGSLTELQKSLGHQSVTTTEESYEHFTHDRAADSARRRIYGR